MTQQELLPTLAMLTKLLCGVIKILSNKLTKARIGSLGAILAVAVLVYKIGQLESFDTTLKALTSLASMGLTYFPVSDVRSLGRDKEALSLLRDHCQDNDALDNNQLENLIERVNKALDEFFRRRSQ